MRRPAPRPLALSLERFRQELAPPTTLGRAQEAWRAVAGEAVAGEAKPVSERAGTLTVACSSSVWAQELELLAGDLLPALNAALGAGDGDPGPVRRLRFVTGDEGGARRGRRRR